VAKISSILLLSTAEVKITVTQGKKSNLSFKYQIYCSIILSLSIFGFSKTLSHLLTTTINHLFSSNTLEIIDKS
jgi:hypothetical protein